MSQLDKKPGHTFVVVTAYIYAILGALYIIHPSGMAKGLGFENLSFAALTDVMATYGGLWIGIGVFLLYLLKGAYTKLALVLVFLTFGGFALGRTIGAIRYGGFHGLHCYWLAFELAYLILTNHFLKKHKSIEVAS
ncbi:MAG: DUF4345 domain-containing protein [Lentisphaeraceae bacterium]|nr:DUF4345 domain-containing protein [Lentisphaeraceae bacterium]